MADQTLSAQSENDVLERNRSVEDVQLVRKGSDARFGDRTTKFKPQGAKLDAAFGLRHKRGRGSTVIYG